MNNHNGPFDSSSSSPSKVFLQQKQSKPFYHSVLTYFKIKNRLHNYLLRVLLLTIFILIIAIISLSHSLISIHNSISSVSSMLLQLKANDKLIKIQISSLNKQRLKAALKVASLTFKMNTMVNISSIIKHEITHLSNKNSPYYYKFREVLSQSLVLRGIDDVGQLFSWFPSEHVKREDIVMELLYRGSRDGDESINLHNKCDDKDASLVLIKTMTDDNKEYVVGGFTSVPMSSKRDAHWVTSGVTYAFCLDSQAAKYKIDKVFNSYLEDFPVIMNFDNELVLRNRFLHVRGLFLDIPSASDTKGKVEPFIGRYYKVEEVEVFRVYVDLN